MTQRNDMSDLSQPGSNLYTRVIEVATVLANENGRLPGLTEVAERIGIGIEALSALFPDDARLADALGENAMLLLLDQCVRSVVQVEGGDVLAQFAALADAYLEWAYRHPRESYIIGAMPAGQFESNHRLMRYEESLHELMLKLLLRARDEGRLAEDDDPKMVIAVAHTFAYGVARKMALGDLSRWSPEDHEPLEAARQAMRFFIRKILHTVDPVRES
ncbi:hypothetical protein [Paracoccus kondratievae]|uniref:Tetracyclin repressor-like C-terminal domain-containing protein n=1 Tax=Paracoccus kondratievae TaxID=135740 RepID=A0AAD3RVJ8_9RHOB|nr:hypothetical protein [Paracoccus kondratievae]GLK65912.1 hypothetical protein GCM10017635_33890 [Paracoccus kondratievae]